MVRDWHTEWYRTEATALYRSQAAMDCPLCGQAVGFEKWLIGPAPSGVPVVRRSAASAAAWATLGAQYAGGTLQGYIVTPGAGTQYARYWTAQEVQQADANQQAKGP
jgi:hypothetical protein